MNAKRTQVTPMRCDTFIEAFRRDDLRLVMPIDLIKVLIMKQPSSNIGQWIYVRDSLAKSHSINYREP
ncbi:hypothetical protein ALC56_04510 [Trachymyrmex septentrionalis]|uniref:Uncharacterized protein n=1 Tax=Trachymyrmex septentrionalis TaxID=34720 RepID=A0A195FLR2_9HYME|nr:hypothetical protein ALC56_04510 [Trachymyrmex septentrionalis]